MAHGGARAGAGRKKQERPVDGNLARKIKAKVNAEKLWLEIIEKETWMMQNAHKTAALKASLMYLDDRDYGKPAFAAPEVTPELNVNLDASDRLTELLSRAARRSAQVHDPTRAGGSKSTD